MFAVDGTALRIICDRPTPPLVSAVMGPLWDVGSVFGPRFVNRGNKVCSALESIERHGVTSHHKIVDKLVETQ